MKVIYWRWKSQKKTPISKSYLQAENDLMLDLSDWNNYTDYPTRVLRKEIEIIKIVKEKE